MVRFIPTRLHGALDYIIGLILIIAPFMFGFADGSAAQWVPIILGIGVIGYSLVTDYEFSVARLIPMPMHLALDAGGGLLLALSPWLFGFANFVMWPHLIIGVLEIGTALMTKTHPDQRTATNV